jgi:molybdenum cofactor cytidylyltransferase
MTTAALLLSGGASTRFGEQPKALLPVGDRTSIRRLAETCLQQGADPVVAVAGAHRLPVVHELRGLPVEVVQAEEWYEGRTASIHAGLEAIPADRDVLLWPVDHPFVSTRTVDALFAVRERDLLAVWFIPTYQGRGGHPVLWRSSVTGEILDLRADAPLRSLLPEFGPQVRRVAVEDPGVVANVDTPEQYSAAYDEWQARERE